MFAEIDHTVSSCMECMTVEEALILDRQQVDHGQNGGAEKEHHGHDAENRDAPLIGFGHQAAFFGNRGVDFGQLIDGLNGGDLVAFGLGQRPAAQRARRIDAGHDARTAFGPVDARRRFESSFR